MDTAYCNNAYRDSDIFARLKQKALDQGKPFSCMLMLTDVCNFACSFCAVKNEHYGKDGLTLDEWKKVIDALYEFGVIYICLTGGEPMVLPWFEEIYRYLIRRGFIVSLKTNGSKLTESLKSLFSAHPPYSTMVTVYGASDKVYKKITGCTGVYDNVIESIKFFRGIPTKLEVSVTVTQDNLSDVPVIARNMWMMGLTTGLNTDLFRRIDGVDNGYMQKRLTPGQRVALMAHGFDDFSKAMDVAAKLDSLLDKWKPHIAKPFDNGESIVGICPTAKSSFAVMHDGRVQFCINYAIDRKISIKDGVDSAWQALQDCYDTYYRISEQCHKCEDFAYCHANCPARFYIESRNATRPDPYTCQFAYLNRMCHQIKGEKI